MTSCFFLAIFAGFSTFLATSGFFRIFLAVFWGARSSSYGKISATPPPHLRSPLLASLWLRPTPPPPYKTRFCVMLSSRLVLDLLGGSEKLEILNPPPLEFVEKFKMSRFCPKMAKLSNRGQTGSNVAKGGQQRPKGAKTGKKDGQR